MIMRTRMSLQRISFVGRVLTLLGVFGAAMFTHAQDRKVIYQINCGGPATESYAQDAYFQGGQARSDNELVFHAGVPNSPPNSAYQTGRYGDFSYTFPNLKPNTAYKVRLHFAETLLARRDFGKRIFSVFINQKPVVEHFDVLKTATDKNVAVVKEFTLSSDAAGKITISFRSEVSEAMVNAIELFAQQAASSDATGTTDGQANNPAAAIEENGRTARLSAIAFELDDRNANTASLVTEAARLCGFAIWKENHSLVLPPSGPPLHLAVTDSEIRDFSAMFRSGQSVALSDLIDSVDYEYKKLGDGQSSREGVIGWLNTGDKSENAAVRALTLFLKERRAFKDGSNAVGFSDPNVQLDPIQALFILRVVTEEIAFPLLHASTRAGIPAAERSAPDFSIIQARYIAKSGRADCGDEGKDWAEDGFVGGMARLMERVMHHFNGKEDAEAVGRANAIISIVKFLSMYSWLKGDVHAEDPPLIRTKGTDGPGDGPRTVVAKFAIDGAKITDWLKEHRCGVSGSTWGLLDVDLPDSKPLRGIETSWHTDQGDNPRQQIIWKATDTDANGQRTAQQSLDRVITDDNGEAKTRWDGAPQPKTLPKDVVPYHRYVEFYVTPQVKSPEVKQDLVDAVFGAIGIKEAGLGLLTPIFEELYRLKWKGTAHGSLMVRDWRPAGPPDVTGAMTIWLKASAHDFRKDYDWQISWERTLEFKDTKMTVVGADAAAIDPAALANLPPSLRQQAEAGIKTAADNSKKITFYGFGPGKLSMTVNDNSHTRSTADLCGDISESEKTYKIVGGPKEFEFAPPSKILPGMTTFTVEVDVARKIAIVKGDFALPVKMTLISREDKNPPVTTNKDEMRTVFQLLVPQAPYDPKLGITVPLKARSLEDDYVAVDAAGYSFSGSVSIPFTFDKGRYKGNAYLTFYVKSVTKSQ